MGSINNKIKLLKTPLNEWHHDHGGLMAAFGEYQLPLWYESGSRIEHISVLKNGGLFDTCHMATVTLEGPGAFTLLQLCFSRDLFLIGKQGAVFRQGKGIYGVFLDHEGHLIDDAVLFQTGTERFLICVNAGKGHTVAKHLNSFNERQDCVITELSGTLGKIDIQGPLSAKILSLVLQNPQKVFASFPYFTCKGYFVEDTALPDQVHFQSGLPVLLARSGYTGEFGFELFVQSEYVLEAWRTLLTVGQQFWLKACGLAARDSLRAGAGLPLAGHDIGDRLFVNTPWDFALPYKTGGQGFTKEFIGGKAIGDQNTTAYTYPFAGFDLRKIDINAEPVLLDQHEHEIGSVLTCVTDMGIDRINGEIVSINSSNLKEGSVIRGLCCGFVLSDKPLEYGETVYLKDRKRTIPIEIRKDIRPARTARLKLSNFL
jgi:aminomethyltransferase